MLKELIEKINKLQKEYEEIELSFMNGQRIMEIGGLIAGYLYLLYSLQAQLQIEESDYKKTDRRNKITREMSELEWNTSDDGRKLLIIENIIKGTTILQSNITNTLFHLRSEKKINE